MFDEIFGKMEYDYGYYVAKKEITFLGNAQEVEVWIRAEEGEEITQVQRAAYQALMQNWEDMQHKVATAILQYYNEEEKESYGPDEEEEIAEWWPDIDTEEELAEKIHLDTIIIQEEFLMKMKGENPIYVLFERDWGGEDYDANGVAVLIEDGEVSKVGYNDMAF